MILLPFNRAGVLLGLVFFGLVGIAKAQQPATSSKVVVSTGVRKPIEATWQNNGSTTLLGEIKQFDGQSLVLLEESFEQKTVESSRVEAIEFAWSTEQAVEAMELFEARAYRQAITALQDALKSGVPRWQQRFLISALIQSADALDNPRTAGVLFLNLVDSSPPAMLYADMPLCWTVREVPRTITEKSVEWLSSELEAAQLLGASWQLFGAESERARQTLQSLASSTNPTVAQLAVAQNWRLVPPPQTLDQLTGWLEYRERMIEPLQLGPTEFIADRLMRIREPDLAIGQWLRIVSQHGERYHRAKWAADSAIRALESEGRAEEAQRLKVWIDETGRP